MIKKTFITALNKEISIYGSFNFFTGKKLVKEKLNLLDVSNHLKFFVEKKSIRKNLKLHLAYINGSKVNTSDQKIHGFSITRFGKRKRNMLTEPIETLIIRAQQDFDVVGGLNPIQVEITDSQIINTLTKYKNPAYKITPLGLLFPASISNDTNRIIITSKKISGVKKAILNYKLFDLLAEIDLDKIANWKDIKGNSIWVNVQFKDHKEINNASHLCFPFVTRTLSDLTSFTIQLQDDQNKKIQFESGEQKTCIFNFQIDIYLT